MRTDPPRLSVLLPAYEHPAGVERILAALAPDACDAVEVLVSDDSASDGVEEAVGRYAGRFPDLRYSRNRPGLGAVANWNHLVRSAGGEHVVLLHHDEVPATTGFLKCVLETLERDPEIDVLVLECLLVQQPGKAVAHMPRWLRRLVVERAPGYLLRRNVIGSPSTLVVRRERYPEYDARLRWLVDVEAYVRLLEACPKVAFSSCAVASVPFQGSITRSISREVAAIQARELAYLAEKRHGSVATALLFGMSARQRVSRVGEALCWYAFRAAWAAWRGLRPAAPGGVFAGSLGASSELPTGDA